MHREEKIALRAAMKGCGYTPNLTLRSGPKGRVSKGGQPARCSFPAFETPRFARLLRMRFLRE